ncbi:MAG: VIT and VWA domain-containing protein, partial [Pseudomonadota bacterium]
MRTYLQTCLAFFVISIAGPAFALPAPGSDQKDRLGGHVIARVDDREISFPSLNTEISGKLRGDLAEITVRQTFVNPTQRPMNAKYLFPLNKDAAVHAMQMRIGDELVSAQIGKKADARKTYETAKRKGKSAALLEQHRPNMFTQEIANLMPGAPVVITIKYTQAVPRVDGAYELRVPLVVGPRYIPDPNLRAPKSVNLETPGERDFKEAEARFGTWQFGPVPNYPPVAGLSVPETILKDRVSVSFDLKSAIPITTVTSRTHKLDVAGNENRRTIALANGKTLDNRDLVLRYALSGAQPQAGLLVHRGTTHKTFSLLIEPPQSLPAGDVTPREMVFVLDTSGSMNGRPMDASKAFMHHALKNLRTRDYFRIIRFSGDASEFSPEAVQASPANVRAGIAYVSRLRANGGTEILSGLRRAYASSPRRNVLRIVVFLSDGYVGNEAEILRMVSTSVG